VAILERSVATASEVMKSGRVGEWEPRHQLVRLNQRRPAFNLIPREATGVTLVALEAILVVLPSAPPTAPADGRAIGLNLDSESRAEFLRLVAVGAGGRRPAAGD